MSRTSRFGRALAVAAALALASAACGDDAESSSATTAARSTTTAAGATTTTLPDSAADALAVYEADWAATGAAFTASPVDPDLPELLEMRTDRALAGVQGTLRTMLERQHRYSEIAVERDPEVVDATDDRVEISDCVHEVSTVVSSVDGSVVEEVDHTSTVTAIVEQREGAWKITSFTAEGVDSCG